jgi:hypothetical protein
MKYKKKYLELSGKKKEEFDKLNDILTRYKQDYTSLTYCDKTGFKQHQGECWNDSIQTLFCFSDSIKNQVQRKLFNLSAEDIVEFAFLRKRNIYLPYIYKYNDSNLKRMKDKLIKYIKLLQERLYLYLSYDKSIKIKPRVVRCSRRDSKVIGIEGALTGLEISRNIDLKREVLISDETDHGGDNIEFITLINLLSIIFLDNPNVLIIENINFSNNSNINLITDKIAFIVITSVGELSKDEHWTGFFKCNNKLFYYDDNLGIIEFNLYKYLEFYNTNKKLYSAIINVTSLTGPLFMNKKTNKYYTFSNESTLNEFIKNKEVLFFIKDINIVKKTIINNEIDYINKNGINLLEIEIFNQTFINIKKYFENGLDINIKFNNNKMNILQYILSKDCNKIELIKYLIEEKNIPIDYNYLYYNGKNRDIIEYLINKDTDITKINSEGYSAFWILLNNVINDDLDILKFICNKLISNKQNIKIISDTPNNKEYLLNMLAMKNYINSFKYLVDTYNVNMKISDSEYKYTPAMNSINTNSNKVFDYIINHKSNINSKEFLLMRNKNGSTLLHIAVKANNIFAINKLHDMGRRLNINIDNIKNSQGKLPYEKS